MRRTLCLAALLSLASSAFAAVDLRVSISTPSTSVPTGGNVTFTATARNDGTTNAPGSSLTLSVEPGRIVSVGASECVLVTEALAQCPIAPLFSGDSRTIPFTVMASNAIGDVGHSLTGTVNLSTVIPDDQPVFVTQSAGVPITMSPTQIDLGVSFGTTPPVPVPIGTVERNINISNNGPSAAEPVTVTITVLGDGITNAGANLPWQCTSGGESSTGTSIACTTTRIGPGETLPLRFHFDTALSRAYAVSAIAWAANATDTNPSNRTATHEVATGVAADFARVLIPFLVNETPGARATWTSQLWAISVNSGTTVAYCQPFCPPNAGNATRLTALVGTRLWPLGSGNASAPRGAMLYMEKGLAQGTTFTSRLFSSRGAAARGVDLPIVRESEFRVGRLLIPTIVLDPSHRFHLRVYDPDATQNGSVRVRVFENDVTRVLSERTLLLATRPETILSVGLPSYPGYAEAPDIFNGLVPSAGSREVGVEIVGLAPGQRLWAFVSATENEGEHVTLATPQ